MAGLGRGPRRRHDLRRLRRRGPAALALAAALLLAPGLAPAAEHDCPDVGTWLDPASGAEVAWPELIDQLATRQVVLLGESHTDAEHHRWQLQVLAALQARRPDLAVGFEMLPRAAQPGLDRWRQGELDTVAFLRAVDWPNSWGYDPALYLPLFHFARMHRLPAVALNVDRDLIRRVSSEGWAAIPEDEREGVGDPAAASDAYRRSLAEVFAEKARRGVVRSHGGEPPADDEATDDQTADDQAGDDQASDDQASGDQASGDQTAKAKADDDQAAAGETDDGALQDHAALIEEILASPRFARFVEAQTTWDRAMAEALAAAHGSPGNPLAVGIVGAGHARFGHGIPHQLTDLGIEKVAVLLPVDRGQACDGLPADIADAVFVIDPPVPPVPMAKPRLGIIIEAGDDGLRVMQVLPDSVADAAGLQTGDVIRNAAGFAVAQPADLIAIVTRQAPGTWLPLTIVRDGSVSDVVARFPQSFGPAQ